MSHSLKVSSKTAHSINPDMIGLFFEDINFAADGGLYAELIENRSFEAVKSCGGSHNYVLQGDYLYGWSAKDEDGVLEISENSPLCEKNPHYARFTAKKAGAGFVNKAYDGIPFRKNMTYKVSFYAREVDYLKGNIVVSVTKAGVALASATVAFTPAQAENPNGYDAMVGNCANKEWIKYETELIGDIAEDTVTGCVFELCLTEAGCMEFDMISVIPADAVAGIFRKDLFEALAALHPGFLRFPGGCIVEGTSLMRRYRWKDTVGPLTQRKINTNLWATQGGNTLFSWEMQDSHYMQSYGIGFYEYFLLCELLSDEMRTCIPLPVLNIGVACQFRSYETVPVGTAEFDEYIQDALDLIEFANGPVTSKFGALRASMGHPESFHLTLLAIGNEQWNSRHVDLNERYTAFENAIHEKYPEIRCLGTAGPFVKEPLYEKAWDFYRSECKTNTKFTYAVDEHYYVAPQWLYDNVDFYDSYPRDISVFAGEYAGHDANLNNSFEAALAEAAMLTGMERNGDVVKHASYAPLFNRIGHTQWTPDMIWFDETKVVLTPSYYVQKVFSEHAGEYAMELFGQEKRLREEKLYVSLVKSGEKLILKVVNAKNEEQTLKLVNEDGAAICANARLTVIKGVKPFVEAVATNAIDPNGPNKAISSSVMTNKELCEARKPEEVSVETTKQMLQVALSLPAMSLTVVEFGE
ncbi:MAG: alpha-L-arabinofuranosidase C-terminal domain-containing protein [Lachnospiraceae bacterium]|nr:alpha-L-arabinofuranosidase C-terminal domain-containing protein [Lachnospiraceae bacterium]